MNEKASLGVRYVRALVLAVVVLGTGAIAHVTGDGYLPSVTMMVMLLAATTVGLAMFLGRPATATRIVLLTVGGQTLVHLALSMSAGHAGDTAAARTTPPPPTPIDAAAGGSVFEQYNAARPQIEAQFAIPAELTHLFTELASPAHAPMVLLHLVAAVVVGLWLSVGEQALWTLVALAVTVLVPALRIASLAKPAPTPIPRAAATRSSAPHHLVTLARSLVRRGPPALLPA